MNTTDLYMLALIAVMSLGGFAVTRNAARARHIPPLNARKSDQDAWNSRPNHHGYITAIWTALILLLIFAIGIWGNRVSALVISAVLVSAGISVIAIMRRRITPAFPARQKTEGFIKAALIALSAIAVLTTFGIVLSLLFESLRFFADVSIFDFLFGLHWSPQTPPLEGQTVAEDAFGAMPVFAGTFLVTIIALFVAGPIGLMIAIYLSEYASKRVRGVIKPVIEILAGIPTVVYGFFALITVGPAIRGAAQSLGFSAPTQSALAAGTVMGVMIIPLISSLSDDVINAVPQELRDGAYALGATKSETMKQVVFRGALPGITGAFLLGVSRAIGETMIVLMAAGQASQLTGNPLDGVTTVTKEIVTLLTGDFAFSSPKTLSAFALGLVLFLITLCLNVIALKTVNRYREAYQ